MNDPTRWRELMRCDDKRLAQIVTVTIASMEFDVRCTQVDDPLAGRRLNPLDTILIEVRERDWQDLSDVLSELIAEQVEFDEYMLQREQCVGHNQRRLLIALTIIVSALAAAGAIDL